MRGKYRDEVCNVAEEGGDRMGNKGGKSERMLVREMDVWTSFTASQKSSSMK